jgi:HSP20 family molecular chaperone IbpA
VTEELRLFDDQDVVEVDVTGAATKDITLELLGDTITPRRVE